MFLTVQFVMLTQSHQPLTTRRISVPVNNNGKNVKVYERKR